jgi:hypothetical protein
MKYIYLARPLTGDWMHFAFRAVNAVFLRKCGITVSLWEMERDIGEHRPGFYAGGACHSSEDARQRMQGVKDPRGPVGMTASPTARASV